MYGKLRLLKAISLVPLRLSLPPLSTTVSLSTFIMMLIVPTCGIVALLVPSSCLLALRWNFQSLPSDLSPPHRVLTASCLTVKLPRFLVFVFWWARFDTSASLADWFPLHTVFVVVCLALLVLFVWRHCTHPTGGRPLTLNTKKTSPPKVEVLAL